MSNRIDTEIDEIFAWLKHLEEERIKADRETKECWDRMRLAELERRTGGGRWTD